MADDDSDLPADFGNNAISRAMRPPDLTDNDRAVIVEIHTPGKYAYERTERVLKLLEKQIGHHVYPIVLTERLIEIIAKLSPPTP